jgi:hypothetical protein
MVIDLDELRTEWHERAVVVSAKLQGIDPEAALALSRRLRLLAKNDLRLQLRAAMKWCERMKARA